MKASEVFGENPMQMDDYGMDSRHYDNHVEPIKPNDDEEDG